MRRHRVEPSGLAAITTTLLSVLSAGDHVLVTDNVYRPSRNFCNGMLARYGVEVSYFDPLIGAAIERLFKPNTKAVLVEAPEMSDIPAIAEVAHARGALVIDDNTWATPLFHRSLDQGVDISMQAATKYIGGHSDIMFGTISANAKAWPLLAEGIRLLGVCAGPDDVFLALRGTRTLSVRLAQHYRSGLDRRLRPVQHCIEASAAEGGRRPARYRQAVGHGLFLGRLRKPRHSLRLRSLSHRDQMVPWRADAAIPHRPGGCRRPQGRSRSRFCGLEGRRVGRLFLFDF